MFSVIIKGRTIGELKANLEELRNEMNCVKEPEAKQGSSFFGTFSTEPETAEELGYVEQGNYANTGPVVVTEPIVNFGPPPTINVEVPQPAAPAFASFERPLPPPAPTPQNISVPQAPVAASNGTEVDSRGFAWDSRIHSTSLGKNKDGSWRYRRGVEQSVIDTIELELRGHGPQKLSIVPPPPPAVPEAPAAPQAPIAPQVVAAPPAPTPVQATNAHSLETFKASLVPTIAKLVVEGKLTHEYINQLKNYFQVEEIHKINDDQIKQMFEQFCTAGLLTKVG